MMIVSNLAVVPINQRIAGVFRKMAKVGFAATLILIPFRWRITLLARPNPPVYGDYTDFMLFAPDIFMLLTFVFWGISLHFDRRPFQRGASHIWISLTGLTLAAWISVSVSWDAPLSMYVSIRFTLLYLFYFYIVNEIRQPVWVILPIGIQLLIQSTVALGQYGAQHDLGLQSFGEYDLDPTVEGISVLRVGATPFLRAYGLTDHPNILGGCLAVGLIILLAYFVHLREQQSPSFQWSRALLVSVFGLSFFALLATFSRSAWIAFAGGSLLIVGTETLRRNFTALKRATVLGTICIMATLMFAARSWDVFGARIGLGGAYQNQEAQELGAVMERGYLFEAGNNIFVKHALLGVGLGVSPEAFKQEYPDFVVSFQPPHFAMLTVALETGIVGAIFYSALTLIPGLLLLVNWQRWSNRPFVIATAAVLFALIIIGLFDYYTWTYVSGRTLQWLGWGLWAVTLEGEHDAVV